MSAQKSRTRGALSGLLGLISFSALAGLLVTVMVTPALAVTSMAASNSISIFNSLPEFLEIGQQVQHNEIYAKDGKKNKLIATVYSQNREELTWKQTPQLVKDTAVAAEDKRFYDHGGIDIQGIMRAAVKNIAGGNLQGASTLTQQLVKNICINEAIKLYPDAKDDKLLNKAVGVCQESSIDRKLKEMKYAIGLEKNYTKDEILLAYLNIAGYGGNTYGIQAAAQRYYGVDAKDLTVAESASLLAIVQEPGKRSLDNPDHYADNQVRRDFILGIMLDEKMISQKQYDKAIATKVSKKTVHLTAPKNGCIAADVYAKQFCDYVVHSVKDLKSLGKNQTARNAAWKIGGYKLYTTLDLRLQKTAQDTVRRFVPNGEKRLKLGGSAVSVEVGTGHIITMAQNKRYDNTAKGSGRKATAINFNTDYDYGGSSGFQVGSTYKTFTLLNWLEAGHGLEERVNGLPRTVNQAEFTDTCNPAGYYGPWKFRNDRTVGSAITVRTATQYSVNGAYVSMALQLDLCRTKKIAEALGVHTALPFDLKRTKNVDESQIQTNPSSILGTNDIAPLTVAAAYAGIANKGVFCKPVAVTSIKDAYGKKLKGQKADCHQAISRDVAAGAASALQTTFSNYNANTRDGTPLMGKTGTTNDSKQTWVTGSSTKVTTVVWVGNISGNFPIWTYPNGGNLRHQIWHDIMIQVNKKYGGGAFDVPTPDSLRGTGVTVGDYVGTTPDVAQAAIEAAKLDYSKQGQVDSELPAGQIARQEPAAGTVTAVGMTVKVWLSNGKASKLPDVTGKRINDAKAALNSKGFDNVVATCVPLNDGDPSKINTVKSMNPGAGKVVARTAQISLGVIQGNC